jgi:hypothetical protein
VIKIRYSDLPTGLHARTVVAGRHVFLYLLPGLSAAERRAAIRRARSNGQVGHGPRLPAAGLATAVVADRIRITIGNAVAAVRTHPGFFVPVTIVLSVAVGYLFLSAVSIPFRSPLAGPSTGATSPAAAHRHSRPATAARHREPGRHGLASLAGPPIVVTGHRRRRLPPGFPLPGPPPARPPSRGPSGQGQPPEPSQGPSPGPWPGPSPSQSPSQSDSGTCMDVGPLGGCLGL